jgi:23S rRNA pseudouridine1911/1915/1917 synthase
MPRPLDVPRPTPLLAHLFASLPGVRRTKIRQWLKFGSVLVNRRPVTRFDHPLVPGDVVEILPERDARARGFLAPGMTIVHEDEAVIVIDKPPNLLSIASKAEREETAYSHLTDYVRRGGERPRERVWIVHRLDRETSGLMVFARTPQAKDILQRGWDQAEKRYLAVVEGLVPDTTGTLRSHLDETNPFKVAIAKPGPGTREAITRYRVLDRRVLPPRRTLVELTLVTGRRHQIRVQLADLGFPIVGDEKYAARTDPAKRLGLHACALRFPHPLTGEPLAFQSPLPAPLDRLVGRPRE